MAKPGLLPKLLIGAALLCARALYSQEAPARTAAIPQVVETQQILGTFTLGGQEFTAMTRSQSISPTRGARSVTTVIELEIHDANSTAVYQQTFAAPIADGRFVQTLTVSGSLLEGSGGRALMLRFLEDPAAAGRGESWQVFGLVNGKLARFGVPLPLGQGGVATNGVLTGVMLQGGIGVVPLASAAEAMEFRAWSGNFFVNVPVRIDWTHGQWSEAEQCFTNEGGSLHPTGCNLRVTPVRQPVTEGATVALYAQPQENAYNAQQISLRGDSAVSFSEARAIVKWQDSGDRFMCTFDDLWLHVRIDGNEGWVHSPTDFANLGLSPAGPAR